MLKVDHHEAFILFKGKSTGSRYCFPYEDKDKITWAVCPLSGFEVLTIESGVANDVLKATKIWSAIVPIDEIVEKPKNIRTINTISATVDLKAGEASVTGYSDQKWNYGNRYCHDKPANEISVELKRGPKVTISSNVNGPIVIEQSAGKLEVHIVNVPAEEAARIMDGRTVIWKNKDPHFKLYEKVVGKELPIPDVMPCTSSKRGGLPTEESLKLPAIDFEYFTSRHGSNCPPIRVK